MNNVLILGLTTLALAFPKMAGATMMEQLDTNRLTKSSRSIHVGEVTEQWSSCQDERCRMIYTYVRLKVEQTLKGAPVESVLVRIPGGQVKERNIGIVVHGMVRFSNRERTLVFLDQDRDGAPSVVGMGQGKFRLYKSHVDGQDIAMFQSPTNVEYFTKGEQGRIRHIAASQVERTVSLKNLIGEIHSSMAQQAGETLNP